MAYDKMLMEIVLKGFQGIFQGKFTQWEILETIFILFFEVKSSQSEIWRRIIEILSRVSSNLLQP